MVSAPAATLGRQSLAVVKTPAKRSCGLESRISNARHALHMELGFRSLDSFVRQLSL